MMYKIFVKICPILCFLLLNTIYAQGQLLKENIEPGRYDPLYIGYDSIDHLITGYINIKSSGAPFISCELYFIGKNDDSVKLKKITFFQFDIDTNLADTGLIYVENEYLIVIKNSSKDIMISPCQNLINIRDGESFEFIKKENYYKIAVIKEKKQFLFSAPNDSAILKAYLIKNDPVFIVKKEKNWILIKYLMNEKIERWIPLSSVYLSSYM